MRPGPEVTVSIDDFGTGYSSLSYLHSLPADVLKIDRSFVQRAGEENRLQLVRTILLLAARLGLTAVAEGIEDRQVSERLTAAGASHGQGYLFSRPVQEERLHPLLEAGIAPPGPSATPPPAE